MKNIRKKLDDSVIPLTYNLVCTIRDAKTGKVKRKKTYHNLVVLVGRAAIAQQLANATATANGILINYGAVGTSSTAAASSDTQLGAELTRKVISSRDVVSNVAYSTVYFAASEANGTLREVGFFCQGTAAANSGTLMSRIIINIVKGATETLTMGLILTVN